MLFFVFDKFLAGVLLLLIIFYIKLSTGFFKLLIRFDKMILSININNIIILLKILINY